MTVKAQFAQVLLVSKEARLEEAIHLCSLKPFDYRADEVRLLQEEILALRNVIQEEE